LLTCGRGELFGRGNAQLPLPPMLMFDRIASISESGGAHGKGQIVAELKICGNPMLDWLWACHFKGDPVMPGCLGLDALWQLTGFFLGWLGAPGKGRALGVGEVKLTGMVIPTTRTVQYVVDLKRVILRKLKLAIADGVMTADGQVVYVATDLRVGLFDGRRMPAAVDVRQFGILNLLAKLFGDERGRDHIVPPPDHQGWYPHVRQLVRRGARFHRIEHRPDQERHHPHRLAPPLRQQLQERHLEFNRVLRDVRRRVVEQPVPVLGYQAVDERLIGFHHTQRSTEVLPANAEPRRRVVRGGDDHE